jgi:hypothetical protein
MQRAGSGGQGRLTEVAQALIKRVARGGLGCGEKGDESENPVMAGGATATADGQRRGELAAVGLTGDRREHETANRACVMMRMDQTKMGLATWPSQRNRGADGTRGRHSRPNPKGDRSDSCPGCVRFAGPSGQFDRWGARWAEGKEPDEACLGWRPSNPKTARGR